MRPILLVALAVVTSLQAATYFPLQRLYQDDPAVRRAALQRFRELPAKEKAVYLPRLLKTAQDAAGTEWNWQTAYRLEPAIAVIGAAATPKLLGLFDDPQARVRGFAIEAVAMIRPADPHTIESLRQMMQDGELFVRSTAAQAILSLGLTDDKAQSLIQEATRGDGEPVTAENVEADYARHGPWTSNDIASAIQALSSDSSFTAFRAAGELSLVGAAAVPALLDAVRSENANTRAGAMQALEGTHLYRADIETAAVQALQSDPSERVRTHASRILSTVFTMTARDARLQGEIDDKRRNEKAAALAEAFRAEVHTRAQVLAAIPADADHTYPLEASQTLPATAPDGTRLLTVVDSGKNRGDFVRVWRIEKDGYHLLREKSSDDEFQHITAEAFHFQGKAYLHLITSYGGNGNHHGDDFFRIESGGLTRIRTPKGLPLKLAPGEVIMNGFMDVFRDDDLTFRFSIWKNGDAHCCPRAGSVSGHYTIVGNELRYAGWKRSASQG